MEKKSISFFALLVLLALCSFAITDDEACISGSLSYSKLYIFNDVEIKEIIGRDLENISLDEPLQIKIVFYDGCNQTITSIKNDDLRIVLEPEFKDRVRNNFYKYEISQNNGEFIIVLNSTLAGKHKLTINYIQNEIYYVTFVPGKPSEKSILEVDKTLITVGENVTVYIIPYDKYENLIDANNYKNKNNPFNVSYNSITSNGHIYVKNYDITKIINYTIISYEIQMVEDGEITIKGEIGDIELNNRTITVKLAEIDFSSSVIFRYNSSNEDYEILKNGSVEKNYETNSTYRIFLKDKYGKEIKYLTDEQLNNFTSYLNFHRTRYVFYDFALNITKKQYIEFVISDKNKIAYNKLVSGSYDLVFAQGFENRKYYIFLDNGCSSDKPFKCSIDNITQCVASQTECDCPNGYYKCNYTHYCVPENNKDTMCPNVKIPNQKVCPIGKVLCADLSCRDKYDDCLEEFDSCDTIKCPDQTCNSKIRFCPKTIDCGNSSKYVCNNDKCVDSELECEESKSCKNSSKYLCDGNKCASSWDKCDKKKSCWWSWLEVWEIYSLCEDKYCRKKCS